MENEDLTPSTSTPPVSAAAPATPPAAPGAPFDPRRRIRELLAIPERDRTDAEWDELNELEIQTAPGNRISNAPPAAYGGKPTFQHKNRKKGGKSRSAGNKHKPRPS